MKKIILISWLPLAIGCTMVLVTVYVTVQQVYRQNANDPQIELVESAAQALSQGYPIDALFQGANRVDMSASLAPFGMVFDDKGAVLASSGFNGTSTPFLPPSSVFDYVRSHGEDRITWQTPTGLRFATVIAPWQNASAGISTSTSSGVPASGFVLAARSLRLVEDREETLSYMILAAWIGCMAGTLVFKIIAVYLGREGTSS